MRILIFTQAVDTSDTVLGFFHAWLQEFAQKFEEIEVVCLKEGVHSLPSNVRVHSLGKEKGASRFKYILTFYKYIFSLKYDAVFVHMNEEYVVLGGLWWRLLGKKVVFWRNFPTGSWMTPIACTLATNVCFTSPDSFTSRYSHAVKMPIGIDPNLFKPNVEPPPLKKMLMLGRIDSFKRIEVFVGALLLLHKQGKEFTASIYGNPSYPNDSYPGTLSTQGAPLIEAGQLVMRSGVPNTEAAGVFADNGIYVNVTASGSFDKTIGEAMAAGCLVVTCNSAVKEVVPEELFTTADSSESVAIAINAALSFSEVERKKIVKRQRDYIIEKHSLSLLATKLRALY
jgi:glycosyltransferase involved in cell wall biosynthesis